MSSWLNIRKTKLLLKIIIEEQEQRKEEKMEKYPIPSRNNFKKYAKENPEFFLDWIQNGDIVPTKLTFALEYAGKYISLSHKRRVLQILEGFLCHDIGYVKEGAEIGIEELQDREDDLIFNLAEKVKRMEIPETKEECVKLLQDALILDENGDFDKRFFFSEEEDSD